MTSGEKLTSLKGFISAKKNKSKESVFKIIFSDGMDTYEVSSIQQIPDISILETEIFFDSPFIQYEVFIDGKKIKSGFIKEKENPVPAIQRTTQNQVSNFDSLMEVLNVKKIMDAEVMAQQNKITEARIEALKMAFEQKAENIQNTFLERIKFKEEITEERIKLREEQLKLEYKSPRKSKDSALGEIALEFIRGVKPETKDNFMNLLTGIGLGIAKKYIPDTEMTGLTPVE